MLVQENFLRKFKRAFTIDQEQELFKKDGQCFLWPKNYGLQIFVSGYCKKEFHYKSF